MTTQANNTTTTNNQPVSVGFGDVWRMSMQTAVSSLAMVNNVAVAGEQVTGVLADKATKFREQQTIADTMKHNALMAQLHAQANELGIEI